MIVQYYKDNKILTAVSIILFLIKLMLSAVFNPCGSFRSTGIDKCSIFSNIKHNYLPTQKSWNIADTISSEITDPVISPRFSIAMLMSMEAISDGI